MRGEDALRKSKAADPGADHALGSSSADEVVEGVSEPLVVLLPFVKAAGRCLLSVMVALGLGREDEVGWKCYLWRVSIFAVWLKMERYSYWFRDVLPPRTRQDAVTVVSGAIVFEQVSY